MGEVLFIPSARITVNLTAAGEIEIWINDAAQDAAVGSGILDWFASVVWIKLGQPAPARRRYRVRPFTG